MTQRVGPLIWKPTGDDPRNNVAQVKCDSTIDTDWQITVSGTDTMEHYILPRYVVVDNMAGNAQVTIAFSGMSFIVSANTRRTFKVPSRTQSFEVTVNSGYCNVIFAENDLEVPDDDTTVVQLSNLSGNSVNIDGPAGTTRPIYFTTNKLLRWDIDVNNVAETGSNAGSDLVFNRYNDDGSFLSTVGYWTRSSGVLDLRQGVQIENHLSVSNGISGTGGINYDSISAGSSLHSSSNFSAVGVATAPTPAAGDNSTNIATTAWANGAIAGHGIASAGQAVYNAPITLTQAAHQGLNMLISGPGTVSFPATAGTFCINVMGTSPLTLSFPVGTDYQATMYPGQCAILSSDGNGFYRVIASGNHGNAAPNNSTWTPTLSFGTSNAGLAYTSRGSYQVVGQFCTATCVITLTAIGTSSGYVAIAGWPIPPNSNYGVAAHVPVAGVNFNGLSNAVIASWYNGASSFNLFQYGVNGIQGLQASNFSNTTTFSFTITYQI